jgi:hypothetical protein
MRILLDENIPAKLKFDFGPDFDVKTVRDMEWQGTKNGALLKLIGDNAFDFFITLDTNLRSQQNLAKFSFTVILLVSPSNKHQILQPFVPKVKEIIVSPRDKKFFEIRM